MIGFDELKSVAGVLQEAGKIEQYKQILEVQKELIDMQKKITDLEKENIILKNKLEIKDNLIFENNAYWIKKDDGLKDGPFCSRCWDVEKNTVRMAPDLNKAFHCCPECNKSFQTDPNYSPSPYIPRKPRTWR